MHDQSVERGESSSQRQAQGAFFTPSSFSSLCWLPTTTPSSSRCAKRGACRSALPRPPVRISSVFVPQILRDAPLGSRAKRRTAASSARKSRRKIGCGGQLDLRIQNTRPLLQAAKALFHRRSRLFQFNRPPKLIHHPTYRAQILSRWCEEVHPVPGQHNGHDRAREGRIFGTDPRVNIWPFGLSTAPRAFSSGSARPPRAPDASGTPRPGSGLSLAWPIRAPSARRATARRRDRRRGPSGLTPAWPGSRCVLASPDARSRRSPRPARAPPDPSASTAARTRAALSAPLSPLTRAVLPWADASSRPAGEPPRARRRRPQLLQRPLIASRAFPGRPGDRRWAAVHRRGSHARLATLCAIRAVSCVLRGVSTLSLRTNCARICV